MHVSKIKRYLELHHVGENVLSTKLHACHCQSNSNFTQNLYHTHTCMHTHMGDGVAQLVERGLEIQTSRVQIPSGCHSAGLAARAVPGVLV